MASRRSRLGQGPAGQGRILNSFLLPPTPSPVESGLADFVIDMVKAYAAYKRQHALLDFE
ncbi:MAG: hypothetical protein ACTFAL_00235 [Candidatus Electronema sp. V4]|uniref:hypothetical protein n=1 Tax=Candidatus Electronema sp. V4 TaxID=3454756 RepID=UPI004055527B